MKVIFAFIVLFCNSIIGYTQTLDLRFYPENEIGYEFADKNKIKTYSIIYDNSFVINEKVDFQKLDLIVNKLFPQRYDHGFLVLDWEGKGFESLKDQKNQKEFSYYKKEFISAIEFIKRIRPNVKTGYYGLPFRQYWNINKEFYLKNEALLSIIKKQDFIAPSLYTFYIDKPYEATNIEYITKNVQYSLKIGKKLNKPVYPFVWHRVHKSNRNFGEKLIPVNTFKNTIQKIIDLKYDGIGIKGLFWWHAEEFFYADRHQRKSIAYEYKNVKNAGAYQYSIFQRYFDVIKKYL